MWLRLLLQGICPANRLRLMPRVYDAGGDLSSAVNNRFYTSSPTLNSNGSSSGSSGSSGSGSSSSSSSSSGLGINSRSQGKPGLLSAAVRANQQQQHYQDPLAGIRSHKVTFLCLLIVTITFVAAVDHNLIRTAYHLGFPFSCFFLSFISLCISAFNDLLRLVLLRRIIMERRSMEIISYGHLLLSFVSLITYFLLILMREIVIVRFNIWINHAMLKYISTLTCTILTLC